MLCAGVFKIYAEGFWLSAPSFFNNINVIAIKALLDGQLFVKLFLK